MMKRLPINIGTFVDSALMMVPTQTPRQPMNMWRFRPYQSAIQTNSAPHMLPIWKMEKMMPVLALPSAGRPK